jgi:hypothetical protein
MTLPLEMTVLTFSNPSLSKTPRSLSFRILGFVGAMVRTPSWRTVPGKEQHTWSWFVSECTCQPLDQLVDGYLDSSPYYINARRSKKNRVCFLSQQSTSGFP